MRVLYDQQIRIQRLKGSGNKKNYVSTATADCSIQPIGKDRNQIQDGVFGKSFIAYLDSETPIGVDDRVVDRNNEKYTVTDVVEREYGAQPYKEVILKKA